MTSPGFLTLLLILSLCNNHVIFVTYFLLATHIVFHPRKCNFFGMIFSISIIAISKRMCLISKVLYKKIKLLCYYILKLNESLLISLSTNVYCFKLVCIEQGSIYTYVYLHYTHYTNYVAANKTLIIHDFKQCLPACTNKIFFYLIYINIYF